MICEVPVTVFFSVAACPVFHTFLSAERRVSREIAARVQGLPFAHARVEVRQSAKFPSFMADVKGLTAFEDVGERVIGHLPVTVFFGRFIPKVFDRRELIWAHFYMNIREQPNKNKIKM